MALRSWCIVLLVTLPSSGIMRVYVQQTFLFGLIQCLWSICCPLSIEVGSEKTETFKTQFLLLLISWPVSRGI